MYKITAPVSGYNGVSYGVTFTDGVGETDNDWLAQRFRESGYIVEEQPKPKATKPPVKK